VTGSGWVISGWVVGSGWVVRTLLSTLWWSSCKIFATDIRLRSSPSNDMVHDFEDGDKAGEQRFQGARGLIPCPGICI
jgi:hypothetical protein